MEQAFEVFARAVASFREGHGRAYLALLRGERDVPRAPRVDEALLERARDAHRAGLDDDAYAALAAHLARASLERGLAGVRAERLALTSHAAELGAGLRPLGAILDDWLAARGVSTRQALLRAALPVLRAHLDDIAGPQRDAEASAHATLAELAPPRHPDAGPEDGSRALATAWLRDTRDLADTAFEAARRLHGDVAVTGDETLWAALAPRHAQLYPREDRFRRVGGELASLGMLEALRRHVRVGASHDDILLGTQLVALAVPSDIRIVPPRAPIGLAAEWQAAEAVGRAAALALASPALFVSLRHPVAGSAARALGQALSVRFADPVFLRQRRGLARAEADGTARLYVAYALVESRLAAAAVLARGKAAEERLPLVEDALRAPLAPELAELLVFRNSASAVLRGKIHGPALAAVLRERFDGDWYRNPRTADPLCGAAARAGTLSAEGLASELGASIPAGIGLYSELF